jgi:hypothetical protein
VPAGAQRFDELKVGDKVSITYNSSVSARLKPPGEAPVDTTEPIAGEGPGGTASVQRTMTVTVDAIDKNASSITFVGPNGCTADKSSIRVCSIRLKLATRLTSLGAQTPRLR